MLQFYTSVRWISNNRGQVSWRGFPSCRTVLFLKISTDSQIYLEKQFLTGTKSSESSHLIGWSFSHACLAKADLSGWHLRQQSLCSFCFSWNILSRMPWQIVHTFPGCGNGLSMISSRDLVVRKRTLDTFLNYLNNIIHASIKFTVQHEDDKHSLFFLDIALTKNRDGTYGTWHIFRKPTHTDRYHRRVITIKVYIIVPIIKSTIFCIHIKIKQI